MTDNQVAHGEVGDGTGLGKTGRDSQREAESDRGQRTDWIQNDRMQERNRRNALGAVADINHAGNISEQKERRREGETYRVGAFASFVVHWVQNLRSINQYGG